VREEGECEREVRIRRGIKLEVSGLPEGVLSFIKSVWCSFGLLIMSRGRRAAPCARDAATRRVREARMEIIKGGGTHLG
jgi:hypothetical protein